MAISRQLCEAMARQDQSIWRGLVVSFPAPVASKMKEYKRTAKIAAMVDPMDVLKHLGDVGKHWSHNPIVAQRFGSQGVGPQGNTFGILLRAKPPKEGAKSELGKVFWDEAEFDIPPGTKIQITGMAFFKPSKDYPDRWYKIHGMYWPTREPKKTDIIRWKA